MTYDVQQQMQFVLRSTEYWSLSIFCGRHLSVRLLQTAAQEYLSSLGRIGISGRPV